ncbi:MAG: hypothetical protein K9N11_04720 [Lentisphaeria bacterium]|nr:hypothetical protein [Candidatus Neomarinimicrobiota bacterium]MCF7842138.1 hypothetical protein [Lentisphaeria bacterium]
MAEKKTIHTINTIVIVLLVLMLIAVIWIPTRIWNEEAELRDIGRERMVAINTAEKAFYVLSESYTPDLDILFSVVNGVYDSVQSARADSGEEYLGEKQFVFPKDSVVIHYTPEYEERYIQLHRELYEALDPSHYLPAERVAEFIEQVRKHFEAGNFVGEQTMSIGNDSLRFHVPERFDILYQNGKFRMFNVLTGSATKDKSFANPLVEAVMDTVLADEGLRGEVSFPNLYETITFEYTVAPTFPEFLEKTKIRLRKHVKFSAEDSLTYGETIYDEAVNRILAAPEIPTEVEIPVTDSTGTDVTLSASVDIENMQKGLDERLNTLYKDLSGGYKEPHKDIARRILAMVTDSLNNNPQFMGTKSVTLDLSDIVFTVNIGPSIALNQIKINKDIYVQLAPRLIGVDENKAAVDLVELVADTLRKRNDQVDWQVYSIPQDMYNVNVPRSFLRMYDDMNIALYELLTGQFNNVNTHTNYIVQTTSKMAANDTTGFMGEHVIYPDAITVDVTVDPDYTAFYDSIFVNLKDTVIEFSDSSFIGVYSRGTMHLTDVSNPSEIAFIASAPTGELRYQAGMADSVREYFVAEIGEATRTERAYLGESSYVVHFSVDSVLMGLYKFTTPDDSTASLYTSVSPRFIVGIQEKPIIMAMDSFATWLDTTVAKKFTKIEKKYPYKLVDEMKYCPVTGLPFRVTIRNQVNLRIESPLEGQSVETRRYLFFTQVDTTAGRIIDGELSWSTD